MLLSPSRQSSQSYLKASHAVLSASVMRAARRASAENRVDLWVVFFAAFKAVLARYESQDEIFIASPCYRTGNEATRQMAPPGINITNPHVDLPGNLTFRELLIRVHRAAAVPQRPARSGEPLVYGGTEEVTSPRVLFAMDCLPEQELLAVWQWNLCLSIIDDNRDGLQSSIRYNSDLYESAFIEGLLLHYQELLKGALANPDQRLHRLPLLTSEERRQLLIDWNRTESQYPNNRCLHQLIEAQARERPDAIAVAFGQSSLTYHVLNVRANVLARRLQDRGVGSGVLVGLCVDRSPEMFIAMLAILKAGGAYVPLDDANPDERLRTMLSEVRPCVVLAQRRKRHRFSGSFPVFLVDEEINFDGQEASDLELEMTSESLAYVIFTSGSTGTPKGVLVSHRSLVNHSTALTRYFDLRSSDRVLQFAPLYFDVAAEEIFPTWSAGATVVPWPAAPGLTTPRALVNFIELQKITLLNLPAPFWQEWVADLDRVPVPSSVRLLVVGTDKVSSTHFLKCRKRIGKHVRLCNAYGLTETTITATIYEPDGEYHHPGDCVPIGRPIANTLVYILDQNLNPLPIGVGGELYIGGACLAQGYLNRPELTAERFIANPFSATNGARLYKTGDFVRYLPDGNLEFLGRIDDQVKLRGFRIELGEVEASLKRIAGVRNAAVIVREDGTGDPRLVAYVVGEKPGACTVEGLRASLCERLPDYMVPSAIVILQRLPLTPGGKVDRQALPPPTLERSLLDDSFDACRTGTETKLAAIWEEMLAVKPVGRHDNFFELGGNSVLGLRLMLQIEKAFGKTLPLTALFDAPTVGLMSQLITDESDVEELPTLIPIQTNGSKPPFFWFHGLASNAFLPRYLGPDQPVYGFRQEGGDGRQARHATIKELAAHHLSEIRSIQPRGPYRLGGYCMGGVIAFEIAQTLCNEGEEVPLLVLLSPDRPENLAAKVASTRSTDDRGAVTVRRNLISSMGTALHRRLSTYNELSAQQKLRRLLLSVSGRVQEHILAPARTIISELICQLCFRFNVRLPLALRDFYIDSVYEQAAKAYVAESYGGFVVLLKPFEDAVDLTRWQALVGDGLETHFVPGNHADVLSNPDHVKIWAEILKRHLGSNACPEPSLESET